MEEVVLDEKNAEEWVYRGEGAANIILSYSGSSSAFVGKVLRVLKAPKKEPHSMSSSPILSPYESLLWKECQGLATTATEEVVAQSFVLHIISPLLGNEHVDVGKHVKVSREFLQSIEQRIISERPAWRVDAAKINMFCSSALLINDHCLFVRGSLKEQSCVAVEIKPKCRFLPYSQFIADKNTIKKSVSRFKMHQLLKVLEGEVSRTSMYDPLDLFSGSKNRIRDAVNSLVANPQNNFRVFFNGSIVYGGLGGYMEEDKLTEGRPSQNEAFADLLVRVFKSSPEKSISCFVELLAEIIYSSGILSKLLAVQKLDTFDIEGAIHAYYRIIEQPCVACQNSDDPKLVQKYAYFHSLPLEESLKIVREYLISATAKDCSLMMSFLPREARDAETLHELSYLAATNQYFLYKVHFIDLDRKPLKKMAYYYDLDQKIVTCYTKHASRSDLDRKQLQDDVDSVTENGQQIMQSLPNNILNNA